MGHRITILGSQEKKLQTWLTGHPDGHERGAIILFRRMDRMVENQENSIRFLAVDFIEMADDWIIDSSPGHLLINMRKLPEVYFRCEMEGFDLGFAHSHPSGSLEFSNKDNINEQNILHGFSGCNGEDVFLVLLVLSDDLWCARARHGSLREIVTDVRHVAVLHESLQLHGIPSRADNPDVVMRQEAAFGKPFNEKLQSLRVVVVGAGGTGSPAATLLARAGIGELIIIDGDVLEESNLNRVRGFRAADVGKNKAEVLANFIHGLGLRVSVSSIGEYLNESPKAIDALSSADVVFGCTDDIAGRDLMNQALYYYGLVYIDIGLTGRIDIDAEGQPYLRDHRGRVSCILPEYGSCLRCQRIVTDAGLKYEHAIKVRPELAELDPETLEKEYYLIGGGEPAPGVGPFTSASADYAVATLMNLIRTFRQLPSDLRADNIWQDFVHMLIHSNEPLDDEKCIYCRLRILLLKDEKGYRLGMPIFGKLNSTC